jgi:sugar phosphate permease
LLVPVWKVIVDGAGWRTAFVVAGFALLAMSIPASLVLRHRPEDLGLRPDGAVEHVENDPSARGGVGGAADEGARADGHAHAGLLGALRTSQFWIVAVASTLVLAGSQAAQLLMLPRLKDAGLTDEVAVAAITVVTLLGAAARLGTGWLADRTDATRLAAASFALQAVGLLAFAVAPERWPVLLLFVLGFGLGADNARLLAAIIYSGYFGLAALGRIQGALYVVLVPGRVLGPVLAAALHDAGYGYGPAFAIYAIVSLAMIAPLLLMRPPQPAPRTSVSPAPAKA